MDYGKLVEEASVFLKECPGNYISEEEAAREEIAGMRIYDDPLFGAASADDPMFAELKTPGIVGPDVFLPADWLKEAKSVLSFFLPFTERVRASNRGNGKRASDEWLHARIEGQEMMNQFGAYICQMLEEEGFLALYPAADARFHMIAPYASNWSERHTAHICGLGTFSLSKGLITEKGMAGRFGSVITNAVLPITERKYSSPFAYCIMCGKCEKNCPAHAIDTKKGVINGKDQVVCEAYVNGSKGANGPTGKIRYGCGKCQVDVPCESRIPGIRSAFGSS